VELQGIKHQVFTRRGDSNDKYLGNTTQIRQQPQDTEVHNISAHKRAISTTNAVILSNS